MGTENSLFTSTLQTPQLCGDLTEILLTAEKKKKKAQISSSEHMQPVTRQHVPSPALR